ncbi:MULTISPECIES: hypothetical protein [unclassified Okeania]|uniref:hypothetical protein n=1 Tax=unclassified Okeania TaxID=2634635 RepID=UPI00257CC6EE|nr:MULTISPECIES: hypothetical protein [unclassified Okeania]
MIKHSIPSRQPDRQLPLRGGVINVDLVDLGEFDDSNSVRFPPLKIFGEFGLLCWYGRLIQN